MAKKDADGAMHEYEEAIRLRPDYPNAHYNLALTLEGLGQFARARQEFEAYLQLAPNAPDAEQIRKHLKEIGAATKQEVNGDNGMAVFDTVFLPQACKGGRMRAPPVRFRLYVQLTAAFRRGTARRWHSFQVADGRDLTSHGSCEGLFTPTENQLSYRQAPAHNQSKREA